MVGTVLRQGAEEALCWPWPLAAARIGGGKDPAIPWRPILRVVVPDAVGRDQLKSWLRVSATIINIRTGRDGDRVL